MIDRQSIIHLKRVENMSGRSIARKLGISRKCVAKILHEYDSALVSESSDSLERLLTSEPYYDSSRRVPTVIVGEVKAFIDNCIAENTLKRTTGLRKQCMQKQDIYKQLYKLGFQVSYSSVCKYITSKKADGGRPSTEAYVRQEYDPGQVCEFDWGEVKLKIDDRGERLYMAVFTLCHSNGRFAYLFRHQDTLAFLESHRNFFREVDGVPAMMVYDNMRVAISKFVQGDKKPTGALLRMTAHYGFGYRFCNIRRGNEKGHVERSVEFVRRQAFCQVDKFESIAQAQAFLGATCEELNAQAHSPSTKDIRERLEKDLTALGLKKDDMGCFEIKELHVDKWSTVSLGNVHFSVPDKYVGQTLSVKNFSNRVQVLAQGNIVAEHEKPAAYGWRIKLEHYLDTFMRKPRALTSSTALKQAPQVVQLVFNELFKNTQDEFVRLLFHMRDNGFSADELYKAYITLRTKGIRDISTDLLVMTMRVETESAVPPPAGKDTAEIEKSATNTLNRLSALMNESSVTFKYKNNG